MTFDVVFLGTGAAVPVPSRGTTSQLVDIHSHLYLLDAGEGVQLALRKNRLRFQKLRGVFISHMHGDHVLGLPGLLSTMSLLGRKEPLEIWGPEDLEGWIRSTWRSIEAHMTFDVRFHVWSSDHPQVLVESERHRLTSVPVKHRIPCCGLKIEEHSLSWKLDGKRAGESRLPFHVRQALKRGDSVKFEGEFLEPKAWCTPPPQARTYVYSGDTRPCESLRSASKNADVLYHDATFRDADQERAKSTFHSTTVEAARLAQQAGVKTLVLGHVSLRYKDVCELRDEALREHPHVIVAEDGLVWRVGTV